MKRVLVSLACGQILTIVLTALGLSQDSREGLCVFIWQVSGSAHRTHAR